MQVWEVPDASLTRTFRIITFLSFSSLSLLSIRMLYPDNAPYTLCSLVLEIVSIFNKFSLCAWVVCARLALFPLSQRSRLL